MARRDEDDMDSLADRVSRTGSIARSARAMKMSIFRAEFLWHRICARLGPQAR